MIQLTEQYVAELKAEFSIELVGTLATYLRRSGPLALGHDDFAGTGAEQKQVSAMLERVASDGLLDASITLRCGSCKTVIEQGVDQDECGDCGEDLSENHPVAYITYIRDSAPSRDTRWVVAIHGMNTHGAWQEDFSFRLAKLYGYAVPVFVYKYGRILFSPILLIRQRRYVEQLANRLRELQSEMQEHGYGGRPDVIAHSFGTWLVSRALLHEPKIQLGRVILTGSIVPPDFDWFSLIQEERVEAVLCHYGRRDLPVRISQFVIPGSGPSGFRGFNDNDTVAHLCEASFGHSDYFIGENIDEVMSGVWSSFLTLPNEQLSSISLVHSGHSADWQASWWQWISQPAKYVLLVLLVTLIALCAMAMALGLRAIWMEVF